MTENTGEIVRFTLLAAAASTGLLFIPGLALAWLLARRTWPGKTLVETLVALPLIMPPVASGLLLLRLFGRRGVLGAALERQGVEVLFTPAAVVLAMAVISFPLFVRSAQAALALVHRDLEEAACGLGAPPWRVFLTVTLPLARHGILAGVVLAFARALGEFGATILVAGMIPGRTMTLPTAIYHAIELGDDATAFRLLLISVAIAFAAIWSSEKLARR